MSRLRLPAALGLALLLASCAGQMAGAVEESAPGFFAGVWHGFTFPFAWLVSIFDDEIAIYAVPNNGGWYDFGYFVGIVFIGVGARGSRVVYRDRVIVRERGGPRPVDGSHTIKREDGE